MRKKHVIRDNIPVIIVTSIISMIGSLSLGYANNILYAGNEVSYDNSVSGLNSTTVQGALDEMCTVADFSDRVSILEGYFQNNSTSVFDGNHLQVAKNDSDGTTENSISLFNNGYDVFKISYDPTGAKSYIAANSNGSWGHGTLDLRGDAIKINGTNITNIASRVSTLEGKIYVRKQTQTISNGVTTCSYPSGFTSTDYLIIQPLYTSTGIFFAEPQMYNSTTYYIYFRDNTTTLPNNKSISWLELWIKAS